MSMSTAVNNSSTVNLDSSEPLFLLNYMYTYTLTLSQETLSNTLGHQFKLHQLSRHCRCDVCGVTIWEDDLTCSRESLHPPLLSSPFFFLPPSLVLPSPLSCSYLFPFSSFLLSSLLLPLFPFLPSHPSPSSLTECQGTVHTRCVNELDKTCSEVSEGCMGIGRERGP